MKRDPYSVIRSRHITEKSSMLASLEKAENNPSVRRCNCSKAVFKVDSRATKPEIASAIEGIYDNVKVVKVNTINRKPKPRRVRGRKGFRSSFKKAVVTFAEGDRIEI